MTIPLAHGANKFCTSWFVLAALSGDMRLAPSLCGIASGSSSMPCFAILHRLMSDLFFMNRSSYSLRTLANLSLASSPQEERTEERSGPGIGFSNCGSVYLRFSFSDRSIFDGSVEDKKFCAKELNSELVSKSKSLCT